MNNTPYTLLEQPYIQNKLSEFNERINSILSNIKWFMSVTGASLAFFLTNFDKELTNYFEAQITLLTFVYMAIYYLFTLESKYIFMCSEKQEFYHAIKKNNSEKIDKFLFTSYERFYEYKFSNFPYMTYSFITGCSIIFYLIRYKGIKISYDIDELFKLILSYNDQQLINVGIIIIFALCIIYPNLFLAFSIINILKNMIQKKISSKSPQ